MLLTSCRSVCLCRRQRAAAASVLHCDSSYENRHRLFQLIHFNSSWSEWYLSYTGLTHDWQIRPCGGPTHRPTGPIVWRCLDQLNCYPLRRDEMRINYQAECGDALRQRQDGSYHMWLNVLVAAWQVNDNCVIPLTRERFRDEYDTQNGLHFSSGASRIFARGVRQLVPQAPSCPLSLRPLRKFRGS